MARNNSLFYKVCKRTFDIVFSLCVLVVLCIPGALLAAVISIESPGGPMFRQKRVGKGGKEINIWKFRSMYADAHEHPERYLSEAQMAQWNREQKVDNDPRVTKIGVSSSDVRRMKLPILVTRGSLSTFCSRFH